MDARCGTYCYWIATSIAGVIAALAVLSYFLNVGRGMPVISAIALLLAGLAWLIGWAGRHILVGR
ncbi:MAG: hypothetical protein WCA56_20440 [Xanthobacteraceae bacterium]|jgi:hypothetical protein